MCEETTKAIIRSLREELKAAKEEIELLREKNRELKRMAITDELTGLYNQRHFHERLEQEVKRNKRQGHPMCLLFLDVDSLKTYNDTYGHLGGDEVLKAVARSLSQNTRKDADSAYRYGGDEFAAILPEVRAGQAVEVAKRVNRHLRKTGFQHVALSFGIAELSPEMDSKTLFGCADEAMYMVKKRIGAEPKADIDKIHVYGSDIDH